MLGRIDIGAGRDPAPVGEVGAGGPDLLAVDHVVVAVAHGAGLEGGEVAAGARLAVEGAPPLLGARDRRDVLSLLLLGAVEHERGSDPGDTHVPNGGAGVGHLLVVDELAHVRGAAAAVLLGPGHREPAARGELLLEAHRVVVFFLVRLEATTQRASEPLFLGGKLIGDELADLVAEGFDVALVGEAHGSGSREKGRASLAEGSKGARCACSSAAGGEFAFFGEQLKNLPEVVAKFIKGGSLRVGAPNAGDTRDEELHFLVPFDVRRERCQLFYPLGRPRPRVAMMLRWISLVPAAIVPAADPR